MALSGRKERGAFINELKTIPKRVWTTYQKTLKRRVNNPKFLAQVSLTLVLIKMSNNLVLLPLSSYLILLISPVGTTTTTIVTPRPLLPTLIPNANFQPANECFKRMPFFTETPK
ncbi:11067_t:CDS:2 [Funneliformis caledonium]|uniref:11067_t:CDS:1 n=1 Tax=Funneliformis caledonium TaxID=1117310 RepID=A0A9N9E2L6_9GLOM|nr:11067_t:CDS:2 [Funneliformis caledonium]